MIRRVPAWITPAAAACLLLAACVAHGAAASRAGAADTVRAVADSLAGPAVADSSAARDSVGPAPYRLTAVETLVLRGTGRGQALEPSGVAVDAFSNLLVADAALHRVQWLDSHGRWRSEAGALGSGPGELRAPFGIAPLGSAGWALLDRENHRVTAYDLFGRLTGVLVDLDDDAVSERVGRVDPVALASDRGGALFVADADRDRLLVFDFSGAFVRVLGGFGNGPGSFRGLAGVGVTSRGELVTAERAGARVQRLDAGGQPRASWPIAVASGSGMLPVAVDDSGRVAVGDERGGRLWVFEPDGRLRASLAGLHGPRALTFAPDGTLLVAEAGAGTVSRYRMVPAAEGAAPARK